MIWTTVVRVIVVVVFWFYLKFIDNNMAGQISWRLMNQEQIALSGEIQDPLLSGVMGIETKIDLMSGLNKRLEENTTLLKQISEKLWVSSTTVSTENADVIVSTWTAGMMPRTMPGIPEAMSGTKGK